MDNMVKIIKSVNADVFESMLQDYLNSLPENYEYEIHYQESMLPRPMCNDHMFSALVIARRIKHG